MFTLRLQFENPPTAPASICHTLSQFSTVCYGLLQFVTVCYSLPQFSTVCYGLLQFVTVCYGLLQFATVATKTTEHFKKPDCVKDSAFRNGKKNTKY